MGYLTLVLTIITTVISQILLKCGTTAANDFPTSIKDKLFFAVKLILTSPYIIGGLSLSILTSILWIITLSKLNLSTAYPFMSLAFPLVLLASNLLFSESISVGKCIGIIVIIVGSLIVSKY